MASSVCLSKGKKHMIVCETAHISANDRIGDGIFRIRVQSADIAKSIRPGQFVMLRPHGGTDPLLARPLALYDTVDDSAGMPAAIDLVYLVMGAGTAAMSRLRAADRVDLWGPLGNTFPRSESAIVLDHLLILAGGIGQTPFLAVLKDLLGLRRYGGIQVDISDRPRHVTFCWGARTASALAAIDDFHLPGVDVRTATDDGTHGFRGNVAELAESIIAQRPLPTAIFACGPEPMLEAVSALSSRHQIPAWVSLETKMACGYGVCFSCVCPVKDEQHSAGWDYRRVCLEGPVFPAASISWHA